MIIIGAILLQAIICIILSGNLLYYHYFQTCQNDTIHNTKTKLGFSNLASLVGIVFSILVLILFFRTPRRKPAPIATGGNQWPPAGTLNVSRI